jgi:predicted amidohydrolase
MQNLRIASLQYFIRPIRRFEEFEDQVVALIEYFTTQLLTLDDTRRPIAVQVRDLSRKTPQFVSMMSCLARKHSLYIAAGSIPAVDEGSAEIYNRCFFFGPTGEYSSQDKLHMTRFETEEWKVSPGSNLKIFETAFGRLAITICYDVEFPELARVAGRRGALILLVPSCTDDRLGFLRVRYCAHARAIENQMYVIHSSMVGSLPMVPAVSLNYGYASILTPCDFLFSRDGILAEGVTNQEMMVIGELDLRRVSESRQNGTVLPLRDSEHSNAVAEKMEVINL